MADQAILIERIRKILQKSEQNGCTPEEAAAAFQLASRLMAEHNLDMAEVRAEPGTQATWVTEDASDSHRYDGEDSLAYGICKGFFFIEGTLDRRTVDGRSRVVIRFFGKPENVQTAKWVFASLKEAFSRLFSEYRRRTKCAASERRMFVTGVAAGFSEKLRDERRAVEMERDVMRGRAAGSTGLAIQDLAKETRRAFLDENPWVGRYQSGRSFAAPTGSRSTLDAGFAAGKALNLNRAVGGSATRKLG